MGILRKLGPAIVLATHSTEIMAEAEPTEMLFIDKAKKSAKRLRDQDEAQMAFDSIGSFHNVTLTQLARNRRLLFVEGMSDWQLLRRFAKLLGFEQLAIGLGIAAVESGGFSAWERVSAFAWGVEAALDEKLLVGAVFDRDYRCEEETESIVAELRQRLKFAALLKRKEIENYLLVPKTLKKAISAANKSRNLKAAESSNDALDIIALLEGITSPMKDEIMGQYIAKRTEFLRRGKVDVATLSSETVRWFGAKWDDMEARLEIVPGKDTLHALRARLQQTLGITLSDSRILAAMDPTEIPSDMRTLISELDRFRVSKLPPDDVSQDTLASSSPI